TPDGWERGFKNGVGTAPRFVIIAQFDRDEPSPLHTDPPESILGEECLRNWMALPSSNATLPVRTGNPYELPSRISFGLISIGGRRGSAASGRGQRMRQERSAGHRPSASEQTGGRLSGKDQLHRGHRPTRSWRQPLRLPQHEPVARRPLQSYQRLARRSPFLA